VAQGGLGFALGTPRKLDADWRIEKGSSPPTCTANALPRQF